MILLCLISWNIQAFELSTINEDTRRALIVKALLRADGSATLVGIVVANGPPRANIGNPEQILVEYIDVNDVILGSHYEWNPRWEFVESEGSEHITEINAEGTGAFQVPLSIEIQWVRLSEMADAGPPIQLLVADVASVIADFCISTPNDANCADFNQEPVADAGGPYEVTEGESTQLDASASNDPDGDLVSYEWDLDTDGTFGEVGIAAANGDETGVEPLFSAASITGPTNVYVGLEVCDDDSDCDIAIALIRVLPRVVEQDTDKDGVIDELDNCAATVIPESVPTSNAGLGKNRWRLDNPDGSFSQAEPQSGSKFSFTTADTGGCSCKQIVDAAGLGIGQLSRGCSTSAILNWIDSL